MTEKEKLLERWRLLGLILGALSQVTADQWRELAILSADSEPMPRIVKGALLVAEFREKCDQELGDIDDFAPGGGES